MADMAADLAIAHPGIQCTLGTLLPTSQPETGTTSGDICTPNEIGGMLMEYGTLSKYTGDAKYLI